VDINGVFTTIDEPAGLAGSTTVAGVNNAGQIVGNYNYEFGAAGFVATPLSSTVPESSTWAMMFLGFAGIGFMACRRKSKPALMALLLGVVMFPAPQARATLLLQASIGTIPFGPFSPTDSVIIGGTVTNVSPDQTITICEGCVDGSNTYSLGGSAFAPTPTAAHYTFFFGNGGDVSAGFLDGQLAGSLAPGQTKTFIFGEFIPNSGLVPFGLYGFRTCRHLSQTSAQTKCNPAKKFRAVFS
jgi:hypothetical protein